MASPVLPRIAITYCTQCKWMLRAHSHAWFGQELLSTFGTTVGEIALIPATGGIFTVHLTHKTGGDKVEEVLIWDRKAENGFPEAKILKQRVRNHIEPGKDLGHSDTPSSKAVMSDAKVGTAGASSDTAEQCEDCA
ncbi:related to selenoprotein domain protein [Ramularia collo-cygni]|uniref:Related to selenoprotein domain protein n=1 Tax=Ramularia collo-cygni TaxID=112498 RepID=A0A2D3VR65_9PEZI|nr:related to selenoprotein domain protein [Ramularia collo-cygni]CZT24778.1 related to selenoprotein domain protein [Ramularia collo-cygni]